MATRTFLEFFSGGGMARLGLEPAWNCAFANDIAIGKADSYRRNFPDSDRVFHLRDIRSIGARDLPAQADLLWGSFPCQDLSLAGPGLGLAGVRSGLIWNLLALIEELGTLGRLPTVLVFENVNGLLNSRGGDDLRDILRAVQALGYAVGVVAMDAALFLPHSRQRLFIVAVQQSQREAIESLSSKQPLGFLSLWTTSRLTAVWKDSDPFTRRNWVWWNLPAPPRRTSNLVDMLEKDPAQWDSPEYTARLVSLMSEANLQKLQRAARAGRQVVGAAYRRTRVEAGVRVQRVEVRFDDMSGCLRTASGGSSRQRLLFVNSDSVRSRLLTPREAARLMGIPDTYRLPASFNEGYGLAGDGVAVPVVSWLSRNLLEPLTHSSPQKLTISAPAEYQLLYA